MAMHKNTRFEASTGGEQLAIDRGASVVEQTCDDLIERTFVPSHSVERDARSILSGKAIDAGRNGGERDGSDVAAFPRPRERTLIRAVEQLRLATGAALPHGTDGVNHVSGGELISFGDNGIPR